MSSISQPRAGLVAVVTPGFTGRKGTAARGSTLEAAEEVVHGGVADQEHFFERLIRRASLASIVPDGQAYEAAQLSGVSKVVLDAAHEVGAEAGLRIER